MLGVEANLDRMALGLARLDREGLAGRDEELLLDKIDPGDELRHGMLDLEPRVQLEEVEALAVQHELGRAGVLVADRAREGDRGLAHGGAEILVEGGGGALLEHLLVAALDRAVALAEMDRGAVAVGQHLDLDVSRPLDVALAEDPAVAKARLGFAARGLERLLEPVGGAHDAHPAPAAAGRRLDDQRVADLLGLP